MFRLCLRLLLALTLTTFGVLARALFRSATRLFCRLLPRLLFFGTTQILGFNPLALAALVLNPLRLATYDFFGLAALGVDLVLLLTGLLFENVALDVGPLSTHFDIDCASAALRARKLEFLLRLALESDLARRRISVVATAMAAPQVR